MTSEFEKRAVLGAFGKKFSAIYKKIKKLPKDEQIALLAGAVSPIPGGTVAVPAAYKGAKKGAKAMGEAMQAGMKKSPDYRNSILMGFNKMGEVGMKKTAGQMMGPMGLMDDDAKMLCKVLEISAAQALSLKKKIKMGHKLPSWAEYKIYKAGDALKSAMASTHSMRDHMPRISIAIKSGPSMSSVLPSNMSKQAMMGNSPFTQQMLKGSGLPGYSKGGPVKKDGYLTDKKGKPYARVHKGEKVVPKDEKTKKAWAKFANPIVKTEEVPALRAKQESRYRTKFGKDHPGWAAFDRNNPDNPAAKKVKIKQPIKQPSISPPRTMPAPKYGKLPAPPRRIPGSMPKQSPIGKPVPAPPSLVGRAVRGLRSMVVPVPKHLSKPSATVIKPQMQVPKKFY